MTWSERLHDGTVGTKTLKEYDSLKNELLPVAAKEGKEAKSFEPIDFQPVQSPGNYEAEFAIRGQDLLFHFWPWNYHKAQESNHVPPRFKPNFDKYLVEAIADQFGRGAVISFDEDMGAFFVKIVGAGFNQFYRELAIKVCETLHERLES